MRYLIICMLIAGCGKVFKYDSQVRVTSGPYQGCEGIIFDSYKWMWSYRYGVELTSCNSKVQYFKGGELESI